MFGSAKKFLLIGFVLVLLAVIPLTVYFLQEQQNTQSQAAKASNLSFVRTTNTPIKVGDEFDVEVHLDPGTNQVIASKLVITYDATKLDKGTTASCSFSGVPTTSALCPNNQAFTNVLEGPSYTSGQMSVTLTVGVDITKAIQAPKTVATIRFKALGVGTTPLAFSSQSNVTSAADPETNVIALSPSLNITIDAAGTPTATPGGTAAPTSAVGAPTCSSLNLDRATTGTAPYAVTFTGVGTDTDGTITKATFNFGDGTPQDVTQGLGTASVSVPIAHEYKNAGTYNASVTFTDNNNRVSAVGTCTKTITVSAAASTTGAAAVGGQATPTTAAGTTTTPTSVVVTATPTTVLTTIAPPGPGNTILTVGALGAIISIVGGLLFFSL